MKILVRAAAVFGLLAAAQQPLCAQIRGEDEAAVRSSVEARVTAWNAGNAHALAAGFAEDMAFVNTLGDSFQGRAAFEERHAQLFAGMFRGSHIAMHIDRVVWLSPDSAFAEISTALTGYKAPPGAAPMPGGGVMRTRLLEVMKKVNGGWLAETYYNVTILPPPFTHP